MKRILWFGATALLMFQALAGATTLTGLVNFSADAAGNFSGGQVWNTLGGDGPFNLYVDNGSGFINHGNAALTSLNLALVPGVQTYAIWGQPGAPNLFEGLNLFFNGNNATPGISAKNNTNTGGGSATANGGSTLTLAAAAVPGANTLTFIDGATTVILTAYSWNTPGNNTVDRVQGYDDTPGGGADFVGAFTLDVRVAGVPEPATALLLIPALGALALLKKRSAAGFSRE